MKFQKQDVIDSEEEQSEKSSSFDVNPLFDTNYESKDHI